MRLPDYKFVQGGNTRVNMSPQAASAAGRGFARMSEDLAGVGMQVAGLFEKAEEVHDQGKMIELQTEMDQMYAGYSEQMMRTPNDALKWREGWDNLTKSKQIELDKRDMSGNLRQRVDMFTSKYYGQKGISVSHNAMRTEIENTRGITRARIDNLSELDRFDEAAEMTRMAGERNILPMDEVEKRTLHFEREKNYSQLSKQMKGDPVQYAEDYTNGKLENSGVSPSRQATLYKDAVTITKGKSIDASNGMNNTMKGVGYGSEEEMEKDERWKLLTPTQQFAHRQGYRKFNDAATRLRYENSKHRPELDGQAHALFSKIRSGKVDSAVGISEMNALLNIMPDDAQKERFQNKINDIEAGAKEKKKTKLDMAEDLIDLQFDQQEESNPKPKPVEVTRKQKIFLDKNFFTEKNLKKYGLRKKDIESILEEAWKDQGGKDIDVKGVGKNDELRISLDTQMGLFKGFLNARNQLDPSVILTGEQKAIADSILAGQPSDVISSTPNKVEQAEWLRVQRDMDIKRAKAHEEAKQYLETYKDAKPTEINKFISNGDVLMKSSTGSSVIEDAPKRDVIPVIPSGASIDIDESPWGKPTGDLLDFESEEGIAALLKNGGISQLNADMNAEEAKRNDEEKKRVALNTKK